MIRVLIADDHNITRTGLRHLLESDPEFKVVAEAKDGVEALKFIRAGELDIAVLDINMPNKSGMDVLHQVQIECPKLPVLIVSMYPEQHAVRALRSGAAGYLTKDCEGSELIKAVRKIATGGRYTSPELAEKVLLQFSAGQDTPAHHAMSQREYQIFELIVSGKSLTRIAEMLSISVKTVGTYRTRILEKMEMETNAELIQYAVENKLLG
jgi:two-component system invasion response regulator UvrY